jgi:hypothetical protein
MSVTRPQDQRTLLHPGEGQRNQLFSAIALLQEGNLRRRRL